MTGTLALSLALIIGAQADQAAGSNQSLRSPPQEQGICGLRASSHGGTAEILRSDRLEQFDFAASRHVGIARCIDSSGPRIPLADAYTRWRIELVAVGSREQRDYGLEQRGVLSRLLSNLAVATSHSVRITMSSPNTQFTVPLTTIGYDDSGEGGAQFDTDLHRDRTLPYFRVQANTSFDLSIASTHRRQRSFATPIAAFTALQNALQLVAPTPALLTTANQQQVTASSTALGGVLRSLTGATFNETVASTYPLDNWGASDAIYIATVIPIREPRGPERYREVWLVYRLWLECPRPSMFLAGSTCPDAVGPQMAAPAQSLRAETILDFEVAANKTLRQHITDQEWFTSFIARQGTPGDEAERSMCRSLRMDIQHLGFSTSDTRLILPAVFDGMPELSRYPKGSLTCIDEAQRTVASTSPPPEQPGQ